METRHVTPEEKKKLADDFIASAGENGSFMVIVSRQMPNDLVQSETLTFIYPQHLTAMRNTCRDLDKNLTRIIAENQ